MSETKEYEWCWLGFHKMGKWVDDKDCVKIFDSGKRKYNALPIKRELTQRRRCFHCDILKTRTVEGQGKLWKMRFWQNTQQNMNKKIKT